MFSKEHGRMFLKNTATQQDVSKEHGRMFLKNMRMFLKNTGRIVSKEHSF